MGESPGSPAQHTRSNDYVAQSLAKHLGEDVDLAKYKMPRKPKAESTDAGEQVDSASNSGGRQTVSTSLVTKPKGNDNKRSVDSSVTDLDSSGSTSNELPRSRDVCVSYLTRHGQTKKKNVSLRWTFLGPDKFDVDLLHKTRLNSLPSWTNL